VSTAPPIYSSTQAAWDEQVKKFFKYSVVAIVTIVILSFAAVALMLEPEYKTQGNNVANCPSTIFTKSAVIFDALLICATQEVPDAKLQHAANVAAEWLDNDGDGGIDEPRVIGAMQDSKALVIMSFDGFSTLAGLKLLPAVIAGGYAVQDLYAQETNTPGRRDASQEEVHHIIYNAGWEVAFPSVFSDQEEVSSKLYRIWKYSDDNGHYYYGDPTCDDSCKTGEFFYLATAAYLGSKADLFSDEMRLQDKEAMQAVIPEIMEIIESTDYVYPTHHWPSGQYRHQSNIGYLGLKRN
jgi:hypothetical protein